MMRIAIVGSRKYQNKTRIKDFIFKLKQKYNEDLIIVSGGCKDGADKHAKKYAMEFDVKYEEYPPYHFNYNQYCVLSYDNYGKPYNVRNYFIRNKQIAETSDYIIAFIPQGDISRGTFDTLNKSEKLGKKTLIIN